MMYIEFLRQVLPELVLAVAALSCLIVHFALEGKGSSVFRLNMLTMVAGLGLVIAGAAVFLAPGSEPSDIGGMLAITPLTRLFKVLVLLMCLIAIILTREVFTGRHAGEYFALILFATLGMTLLISGGELLIIFVAFELTSLSLYTLTAFHKREVASAEAGLKYFLFGGVSAAFMAYGFSFLYGFAGSTRLPEIAMALQTGSLEPFLALGVVMTLVGFGFKTAAVPFHLWTPDTYEGAPISSAAFIASGSKLAGFFVLAMILGSGLKGFEGGAGWAGFEAGWVPLIAIMALLSMVIGNVTAIVQGSVKRLLAYSAIGHSGYLLLGLTAASADGVAAVFFYAVIYGLTTLGAFAVVAVIHQYRGGDRLSDFVGLREHAPGLSLCMLVFLISLAGLPPLAGFFGKFYLFTTVMNAGTSAGAQPGMLWLVAVAVAMSGLSLYYYLVILKKIYVEKPFPKDGPVKPSLLFRGTVGLLAVAVIVLGCYPNLLLEPIHSAVAAMVGGPP